MEGLKQAHFEVWAREAAQSVHLIFYKEANGRRAESRSIWVSEKNRLGFTPQLCRFLAQASSVHRSSLIWEIVCPEVEGDPEPGSGVGTPALPVSESTKALSPHL